MLNSLSLLPNFLKLIIILFTVSCFSSTMILNIATWNVRGLTRIEKQHLSGIDCDRYHTDIISVQETKTVTVEHLESILPTGQKLVILKQTKLTNNGHGGLGFIISKRLLDSVISYKTISDRVAYLDFQIPCNNVNKPWRARIVNCYSPTLPKATKNPILIEKFYDELSVATNVPSRVELFVTGDFNAKLGKRSIIDEDNGLSDFMGKYGVGRRNDNGEHLLNFIVMNNLFVTNTSFKHSSRHITTRTGWIKDRATNYSRPFYSQIDYILCRTRCKPLLSNARSYSGTLLESDHKIVVTSLIIDERYKLNRTPSIKTIRYNTTSLVSSKDIQHQYKEDLNTSISLIADTEDTPIHSVSDDFGNLFDSVKASAKMVVGLRPKTGKKHFTSDPSVVSMSEERHKIINQLNDNSLRDRSALRKRKNKLMNGIRKRLKFLKEEEAKCLADEINSTDDCRRMFEAVKLLRGPSNKAGSGVVVHDSDNNTVTNEQEKADIIRVWFAEHYTGDEPPLEPFVGEPAPLDVPITAEEVRSCSTKLKNNKAIGPDGIPNELLKYAGDCFFEKYADLLNRCFTEQSYVASFGQGYLTPLQKPKPKPKGPLTSLRPLCLLNGTRKILSMITLKRIETQVANYTGPWQCAYKAGFSCSTIVWTQRIILSVVLEKHWSVNKMSVDMSSAFDTIRRSTILALLQDAGCSSDDTKLVRFLLSHTKLRVKINSSLSAEFECTVGAYQGDALSGCLFTLYSAGALHHLRAVASSFIPNPPYNEHNLQLEWEYSDDEEFLAEVKDTLDKLLLLCKEIFGEWNLKVNEGKTEFTKFYIAGKDDLDAKGEPLKDREEWRSSITLGSKLCTIADINHRCNRGNHAFHEYKKIWLHGTNISLKRKLMIYEAQVTSVILYNSSSWAMTQKLSNKLDVCQRKHLRQIVKMQWPSSTISNTALYKLCNFTPLSVRVIESRWKMLGHVLRSDDLNPSQLAMYFAVDSNNFLKGRIGRHQANLLSIIKKDLRLRDLNMNNIIDLNELRMLAHNRTLWRELGKQTQN